MKIVKIIFKITDVMDQPNAESMIEHLTDNPETLFTKNLKNIAKLTKSNVKFDAMKTMASNYIIQIKDELPSFSKLCSKVAMAMVNLANVGLRLVNKVIPNDEQTTWTEFWAILSPNDCKVHFLKREELKKRSCVKFAEYCPFNNPPQWREGLKNYLALKIT